MLFFTESSRFSVVNQLMSLSQSGDQAGLILQTINNQGVQDILWSVKVGAIGFYYSFLTYWVN
jgi:hypothetical protein